MSGAWIRAAAVVQGCRIAMDRITEGWKAERAQSIALRMARGRWSWRKFRDVPLTHQEAEAENNGQCRLLDYKLGRPMNDEGYAALQKLLALAVDTERMIEGAQVFVSAEDHWRISSALQTVDMDGVGFVCGVPDDGCDVQRDGEHRP